MRNGTLLALSIATSLAIGELTLQVRYRIANGAWLWGHAQRFEVGYTAPVNDRREYALRAGYKQHGVAINELGFRGPSIKPGHAPVVAPCGRLAYVTPASMLSKNHSVSLSEP